MTRLIKVCCVLFLLLNTVFSAKILGIFPVPSGSHRNLYSPLMKELVERGHDVTIIAPYEENFSSKNGSCKSISLPELAHVFQEKIKQQFAIFETVDSNVFQKIGVSITSMTDIAEKVLAHEDVQKLIRSQPKFDLVIISEVLNHAHKALAPHFGAPLILFSTIGPNFWVNSLVGNPAPTSYVPDVFSGYYNHLSLSERFINTLIYLYTYINFNWYFYPKHDELIKKYIPRGKNIEDVIYNVSLVLLNSHPSINQPVPLVPNMIEIGGFHVKPPKELPQDLQDYLDSSSNGVIYFSMGSNIQSADLPKDKREAFLKTFSKLEQNILWKWEDDVLPGQPPNVKLGKWLPQQDILAHPNIKLFITHGGLLSTTETVYHGVPVLAIPIFGDQKLNAKVAEDLGFGKSLSFNDITEQTLTMTIRELLNNPRYKTNAKFRSKLFHDRPNKPLDTAMYWIEYVIRHQGAPHLKVVGVDLPWYQYFLVDIMLLIFIAVLTVFGTVCLICRKILFKNSGTIKIKKN